MAKRRRETEFDGTMPLASEYNTVFLDTNLDTHLAMLVSATDTVLDFKKKIIQEHVQCFPQIGEIQIHSMKVKRNGNFYHLPDFMLVWSAFHGVKRTWFLSADICGTLEGGINQKNSKPGTLDRVIGEKVVLEMSDELMIKNSLDKTAEFFSNKPVENSMKTACPAMKKRKVGHDEDVHNNPILENDCSNFYPSDKDTLEPVLVGCRNSVLDAGLDEHISDTSPLNANVETIDQFVELEDQGKTSPMKIDSPIIDGKDTEVDQPDIKDEEQKESVPSNDFPGADGEMGHGTRRKRKSKKSKGEIRVETDCENSGSALHLTPPPVPNPEMDTLKNNEAEKTDGMPTAETDLNLDSEEHKVSDSSAKLMAANLSVEDAKDNSNNRKKKTAHKERDTLDKELGTKKTESIEPHTKIRKSKKKDEERKLPLNHDFEASKTSPCVVTQKEAVSGSKLSGANISEEPEISSGITTIRKKKRVMKSPSINLDNSRSMEQTKDTDHHPDIEIDLRETSRDRDILLIRAHADGYIPERFSRTKGDMENGEKKKSKSKKSRGKIHGEIDGENSENKIQLTPPNLPNLEPNIPKNHEIEDTWDIILPIDETHLTLGSKEDINLSVDHDLDMYQQEADLTIKEPNVSSGATEIGNTNGNNKKRKKKSRKGDAKIQDTSDVQPDQAQKNSENKPNKDSNPNEILEADRNVIESVQQENSSRAKGETENGNMKKSKARKSRGKIHDETDGEHSKNATHLALLPLPNLDPNIPKNRETEGDSATLMDANANSDKNKNKKKKKTQKPTEEIQDTTSYVPLDQAQKNIKNVLKTDSNPNDPHKKSEAQEKNTSMSKSSSEMSKIIPENRENKSGQLGINMLKKIVSETPQKKSLFSKSGAIFEDSSGESCGDENGPAYSDASTCSPSDSSSQSAGESELSQASTKIGSNGKTAISTGGKSISKLDLYASNGMPLDLNTILRSSKRFKKAKLIASQIEDEQPIEFPASQNDSRVS